MEILHVKVIAMPFLPIPPYTNSANPISNITPFTYGDGYTYLSLLEDMRVYLNTMIDSVNANTDSANDVVEQFTELVNHVNDAIADYGTQLDNWSDDFEADFKTTFDKLRADMLTLVLTTAQTGVMFNPTRGFYDPINQVISNIYDFIRYGAFTVSEYDSLTYTAEWWDGWDWTAYKFDVKGSVGIFDTLNSEGKDTGWVDILNLVTDNYRAVYSKAYIRRRGDKVELQLTNIQTLDITVKPFIVGIPERFAPINPENVHLLNFMGYELWTTPISGGTFSIETSGKAKFPLYGDTIEWTCGSQW